jgi:D-alanyl-D-alanine carboxypeptidase
MEISPRTKKLIAVSICIVILALASNESTKDIGSRNPPRRGIPYPFVPSDIDPNAIIKPDLAVSVPAPVPTETPKPQNIITAESYIVADPLTGEHYADRNTSQIYPIASLSKLITAIVASRNMQLSQKITITQQMLDAYGDAGHLVLGETYTLGELLYPLLLESSNDAAEGIAIAYGYDSFIQKMNDFVRELGMTSTSFKDASGLNSGNRSNTKDLLLLAKYIYGNEKTLLEVTRQPFYAVASTTEHRAITWKSINPFPYDPHFLGGKTGRTTEAKESMMSFFQYDTGGRVYPVVIIVLRSDFSVREVDSTLLFSQFLHKIGVTF